MPEGIWEHGESVVLNRNQFCDDPFVQGKIGKSERERGWVGVQLLIKEREERERRGGKVRHLGTEGGAGARVARRGIGCLGRGWFLRRILASLVIARNEVKLTAYAKHPPTARTDSPGFPLGWLPDGELNIPSTLRAFFSRARYFTILAPVTPLARNKRIRVSFWGSLLRFDFEIR